MFHPDHRVLPITGGSVVTRGRKNVRMPPTTIKKANDLFLLPIDSIHESPLASKRGHEECGHHGTSGLRALQTGIPEDRKSTRLNSSHPSISYAVFCLKK